MPPIDTARLGQGGVEFWGIGRVHFNEYENRGETEKCNQVETTEYAIQNMRVHRQLQRATL
jgi:hypothetical protein